MKVAAVANRQPGSSGCASSIQPKTGTNKMRKAVNAFGTFQELTAPSCMGSAARPPGVTDLSPWVRCPR